MSSKTNTTITKEEATPALVPKLRFPEFRRAEGWNEKPLKAAAEINPANGGLPESFVYIDLESVDAGQLKAKERISRDGAPSRAQRLVERGDIIYQVVRPYQRNNLLCEFDDDENYVASTGYAQLRAKGSNRFLYQSIHTDFFVGRVIAKCTGSNYPAINSSDLAEIHLPIPPTLPEQQKIAECLSSVDVLMAAQAQKVDALKTHKKGLMQQLFPREGETQPRLRFPEFQNAEEWVQKPLGGMCRIRTGKKDANEGAADGIYPFFTCAEKHIYSHNYSFDAEAILIAGNANVGQTNYYHGKFEAYQRTYVLTDFKDIFVPYLYSVLNANLRPDLLAQVQTSAMSYIRLPMLEEYQINAPPTKAEQQRISTCLSSLDALITAETRKHEALKTHKKGLMQQLFPSPEEVEA